MKEITFPRPSTVFVDDLFDELLDLSEEAREEALNLRCVDDTLQDEVRALLEAADALSEPHVQQDRPTTGDRIAHYRLETCLGEGASGSVWTAYDTKLQSWTALKVFHGKWLRRGRSLDLVLREARAASQIISDHVVLIRNAGWDRGRGWHYLEMLLCAEYAPDEGGHEGLVVGRTLASEAPMNVQEIVRLVGEASLGVEAAHRVGVTHRDIKPANILVMPVSRRALVADFGLSVPQVRPTSSGTSPLETSVHIREEGRVVVGTPCFMPPEQARGEVTTRTADIYSLGATLYTLLAGHPPYVIKGEPRPDARTVIERVKAGPPSPLSNEAPHLPKRLVKIVETAMDRDPNRRYTSADLLARDLADYRAHRPTSQDGRGLLLRSRLFVRRHPTLVYTVAALGTVLLAFGGAVWSLADTRAALEHEVTELEERRLQAEEQASIQSFRADRLGDQAARAQQGVVMAKDAAAKARASEIQALKERASMEVDLTWAREQAALAQEERSLSEQARQEAELESHWANAARDQAVRERENAESALEQLRADLSASERALLQEQADTERLEAERLEAMLRYAEVVAILEAHEATIQELEAALDTIEAPMTGPETPNF